MKILLFILRLFAGKISAAIASAVLYLVLVIIAKLAALSPQLAATIDPAAAANWIFGVLIALVNILTNKLHITELDAITAAMTAQAGTLQEPVKPAIPVKP